MSFIASMVSAAGAISAAAGGGILGGLAVGATGALGGAGLGAAGSAIAGDDPLEGAKLGAGIGSAVFGGLGALGQAGIIGSAAPIAGSTVPTALPTVSTEIGKEAIKAGTEEAIKAGTEEAIKTGTEQVVTNQGIAALPNGATTMPANATVTAPITSDPSAVLNPAVANQAPVTGQATNIANVSQVAPQTPAPVVQGPQVASKTVDPSTFEKLNLAAKEGEAGWGESLLSKAGVIDAGTTGGKIGGQALENAVYGAGINGLVAGAQGQDVGKAMGIGALSGGVGGAAGAGLAEAPGAVGQFAAAHPTITSGAIGMGANAALSSALESSDASEEENSSSPFKTKWRVSKDYKPYISKGTIFPYAEGGITDLDVYDQTPKMQSPGTLDIPNRNEVANNQGYMGNSVQMMARGGMAYADGGALGGMPGANIMKSVYGTTLGDAISPELRDFLFGTPDDQLSDEQKAKKKELLAQQNQAQTVQQPQQDQEQGMARGGISDLGGYSDGGRLLKGPGDGVSDDIPASIGGKQPARLAEGEFVVPARIVSELGNGSTDAGAKRLYQMMERIQSDRKKTTGKGKFSDNPKAYKHLPA